MTFSIAVKEPGKPYFGVAVATKHFAVGALVPHLLTGTGAIATQANTNPYLGIQALTRLKSSDTIKEALSYALKHDPDPESRQVHGVDSAGRSWAFTGKDAYPWKGHLCGENYSIAGNLLAGKDVLTACEAALNQNQNLAMEERLLLALQAGEDAGGDARGKQSAALLTVREHAFPWCNLRVDDHPDPLTELARLLKEFRKSYYQNFIRQIPAAPQ